jgi:hypothetical protein
MPLFAARNSIAKTARAFKNLPMITSGALMPVADGGISLIDTKNRLLPEVVEILKIIKDYDMAVATGHISPKEIFALVDKAKGLGIKKIVATHCMFDMLSDEVLSPGERQTLTREGVYMEHTAICILPTFGNVLCQPREIASAIKHDGPENCIMSTDFGHVLHPTTSEGMRMFISAMLRNGLSEEEITRMVKTNPRRLLGLTSED